MNISIKHFSELSVEELYELLKLRVDIFVVEQNCAYEELDNQDQQAWHLLVSENKKLIAYARILFEKEHLHIGRIITTKSFRGKGIGTKMMQKAMDFCETKWPTEDIYLSAQQHLEKYYSKFGYKTISSPYDWDGIIHIDMKLAKSGKE